MKSSSPLKWFATREGLYYVALAVLLVVLLPLALDPFRLNMVGKYLTYAFVAIGLASAIGFLGAAIATTVAAWIMVGLLSRGRRQFGDVAQFDDRFRRMWNYYLTACAGAFDNATCDVTQITMVRPDR